MDAIRQFCRYYRNQLPLFLLDFFCAFVMSGLELVFPILVSKMIDQVLPARDLKLLLWMGAVLFIINILKFVLQYIVDYWGHVLGVRMEYAMRQDLFHHLHKLSVTYFNNTRTGHIMSRLVNDLNEIAELAHHGPEDLFIAGVTLTGSFFIMLNLNWQLTLITFSLVLVMILYAVNKNRGMKAAFREMRVRIADINAQAEDSFSGARVVKSFTNERYEEEKFNVGNAGFRKSKESAFRAMALFYSGINFFSSMISLVVMVFGGILVYKNLLSIGELVGFFLYVGMFIQPIKRIGFLMEHYQKGMAGFSRFMEVMNIQPDITDDRDARDLVRAKGEIAFDRVTFSYNNRNNVLENISFHISPGQTIALVGPSGGGKTTLCNLIPRFYEADEGSIKIDGIDIKKITQKSLRKNIGIVEQDVFLFSGTVKDNISYGRIGASHEEIVKAAKMANAHDFIMSLEKGYDTYIGERGIKLSGGQKQRISIARVFLKDPPILILDEATSSLDNETEKIVQESLYHLSQNRTTLVIAHRLSTIRNADLIMVLTDEGIAEMGWHEELLSRADGTYAKLYRAQFNELNQD